MARTKRRMSATDFDAIRPLLPNIREDRCAAARAALVDGETLAAIATRYGWSRQAINTLVNTFCDALTRYHEAQRTTTNAGVLLPPGWEQVTLIAPSALIEKFRTEIAAISMIVPSDQKKAIDQ
jgi:dsRNA-specific ribonuclease